MTSPSDHAQVKALFLEALELSPADRKALFDTAPEAIALAARTLLERDEQGATPFEAPIACAADALTSATDNEPERVDTFRILKRIGAGGMGVVYEAVEGGTERHVALKLLAPGLVAWSGPKVKQRFRREIIALSRLEHPGIARILSHGELASDARPWFAMELVHGRDLTTFIKEQRPRLVERVQLFRKIAAAVAHAHKRGIAHRDLKPQNILVTDAHEPKVLDFGIARMFEDNSATRLTLERTAAFVGTLAYLPPERLNAGAPTGVDVDGRRGDVYALGCVFWEALFGRLPLPLDGTPLPAALEILRTEEISSPRRLKYETESGTRAGHLPRDLAVILEACLAREPARRYSDAGALTLDIERYLASRPIHARAPTVLYRALKFIRRHRALVAATLLVIASLVAGIVTARGAAHRAQIAEAHARAETLRAQTVRSFLLNDMLRAANPWRSGQISLIDLLEEAQSKMAAAFKGDAETLAELRLVLGETWAGIGRFDHARKNFAANVSLLTEASTPPLLASLAALADLELNAEQPGAAAPLVAQFHKLNPGSIRTAYLRGRLASLEGRFDDADLALVKGLNQTTREQKLAIALLAERGRNALRSGHYDLARKSLLGAIEAIRKQQGKDSPQLAPYLVELGDLDVDLSRFDTAEAAYEEADLSFVSHLGEEHPARIASLAGLGTTAIAKQDFDTSEALLAQARQLLEDGDSNAWRLDVLENQLGYFTKDIDRSLAAAQRGQRAAEARLGSDHPLVAKFMIASASPLEWLRRPEEALAQLERAEAILAKRVSPLLFTRLEGRIAAGVYNKRLGHVSAAIDSLAKALNLSTRLLGPTDQVTLYVESEWLTARFQLAKDNHDQTTMQELLALFQPFVATLEQNYPENYSSIAMGHKAVGDLYLELGDFEAARTSIKLSKGLFETHEDQSGYYAMVLSSAAVLANLEGRYADAVGLLEQSLLLTKQAYGENSPSAKGIARSVEEARTAFEHASE